MTYLNSRLRRNFLTYRLIAPLLAVLLLGAPLVSATVAAQENGLVGDYTVTLTREDIPFEVPAGAGYIGRWRISFSADGTYLGERQDVGQVVNGTYEVSGNNVTITDDGGQLSCSSPSSSTVPGADATTGEYEWAVEGQSITFVAIEDNCGGREILLATRPLSTFLACETDPLEITLDAPIEEVDEAATPEDEDDEQPLDVLTPESETDSQTASGTIATEANLPQVEQEIDDLLLQMTACWATGEPEQWLPLLSTEFRTTLENSGDDFVDTLSQAMTAPIDWERAGDFDIESESEVSCIVKATVAQEDDFQRFTFVLEDGEWKWNG